ncbi:MAG: Trm112 family protein [Candidatus Eutrophobiaceae bacterium]
MEPHLLDILVCPVTKGKLLHDPEHQELLSLQAKLAYPIREGVPVMLEGEARVLSEEEIERIVSSGKRL